jgi:2-keto-4-pentenoate hydratase/2-oxohepta-3-ene-1,7-dioic acid hydratase in catechol pathway
VVDLNRALAVKLAYDDGGAPEAEADSLLPADMNGFLRRFPDSLAAARSALEFVVASLESYEAPDVRRAGLVEPRRRVRLCAPVPRPGKILAVARNYPAHASERGSAEPPVEPILFLKATSAVIGPEDEIVIPAATTCVDYEGELAVVIGRRCRHVPKDRAHEVIAGYTICNDVSVRDWQIRVPTFTMGKSFDTHCPLGPAIVTADEIGGPSDLELKTLVNGEVRQHSNTKELIFDCFDLVEHLSTAFTLEPGDVISTGTPGGVAVAMKPPKWLVAGDVMRVEIAGLGALENTVVDEPDTVLL